MDKIERITALHRILKAARYPVTVKRLQEELGCSRATVYRDLAYLRDALMAPIEGDGEAADSAVEYPDRRVRHGVPQARRRRSDGGDNAPQITMGLRDGRPVRP